jgi:23S rRNA pseudouridine1911/1915/1917 synthase
LKYLPQILYKDASILIADKPAGWLSIPDRFDATKSNMLHWLRGQDLEVRVVHRLDRDTSGIMIFAMTEDAHRHLSRQFEQRETVKIYTVLVDGLFYEDEGEIIAPIGEDPAGEGRMRIHSTGKHSHTRWRVIQRFKRFTLLEAMILTGRTHQIRVHFRHINHALVVDKLYGQREGFMMSEIKGRKFKQGKFSEEELPLMGRTTLHSTRIRIKHPETEEEQTYISPLPKDFRAVLRQLELND